MYHAQAGSMKEMIEKELQIGMADGSADAVLYKPEGAGPYPGVLYLTDIGGIRPATREMAGRFVAEGYVLLMPNVFYRTSRPPVFERRPRNEEEMMKRVAELGAPLTPEAIETDASGYIDFLESQTSVDPVRKLGVVGHCFTGAVAMRVAAARPDRIGIVTSFHGGRLFTDDPTSPHLMLPRIKAELYFGHAVNDRTMPEEAIRKFERALKDWGGKYESEVYDGAYHSWTVPDSPVYNETQAERAFSKLSQLFASRLQVPSA
jgi:carboxymethylenebutenolidase